MEQQNWRVIVERYGVGDPTTADFFVRLGLFGVIRRSGGVSSVATVTDGGKQQRVKWHGVFFLRRNKKGKQSEVSLWMSIYDT